MDYSNGQNISELKLSVKNIMYSLMYFGTFANDNQFTH